MSPIRPGRPEAPALVTVEFRDTPTGWQCRTRADGPLDEVRHVQVAAVPVGNEGDRHRLVVVRRTGTIRTDASVDAQLGPVAWIRDAVADASSRTLIDGTHAWDVATAGWGAPTATSLADLADTVGRGKLELHQAVLGDPTTALLSAWGVQPLPTDALGAVATAGALPGDGTVRQVKLLLQATGMIAGALAGNPVLVSACLKSWLHDRLRDAVARRFVQLVDPAPRT